MLWIVKRLARSGGGRAPGASWTHKRARLRVASPARLACDTWPSFGARAFGALGQRHRPATLACAWPPPNGGDPQGPRSGWEAWPARAAGRPGGPQDGGVATELGRRPTPHQAEFGGRAVAGMGRLLAGAPLARRSAREEGGAQLSGRAGLLVAIRTMRAGLFGKPNVLRGLLGRRSPAARSDTHTHRHLFPCKHEYTINFRRRRRAHKITIRCTEPGGETQRNGRPTKEESVAIGETDDFADKAPSGSCPRSLKQTGRIRCPPEPCM